MARRKVRIELEADGAKYTFTIEGSITKDKVLKFMELIDLLSPEEQTFYREDTLVGRISKLIEEKFPYGAFTSTELLELYEDEYNEPIKLSTISTYLSRLSRRGFLTRRRTQSGWVYQRARLRVRP